MSLADHPQTIDARALESGARVSLRTYLTQHPALADVIRIAGQKMRSYSGLSGEITLKSAKAVDEVRGIGATLHSRDTCVRLTALNDAMLGNAFACTLREAVDAANAGVLVFLDEERRWQAAAAQWFANELSCRCAELGAEGVALLDQWKASDPQWVNAFVDAAMREAPAEELKDGIPDQRRLAGLRELADTRLAVRAVVTARASVTPVMLPVLAERLSRDPHALDQDQSAGRAFLILLQRLALRDSDETQAIDELHGEDRVRRRRSEASSALTADERAAIYAANNVAIDAISSTVAVWHLLGGGPVVAAARTMGMPIVLPLAALDMILTDDQVRAARNIVWVVENPAAFQALIATMSERSMDERPTLVCGSGFFSLAALRLLDRLVAAGARVLYSGDWDSNGLAIAHVAMHRWKGQFHLWRMDPSQDMNAPIDIERAPWHKDVAPRSLTPTAWMIARQRPRYQEAWIDALAMDLSQALSERLNDPAGPESRP